MWSHSYAAPLSFDVGVLSHDVPGAPVSVVTTDFNGDGIPDLAIADAVRWTIQLLYSNGTGGLTIGPALPCTGIPTAVAVGDLTGDGVVELLATVRDQYSTDGTLYIWYGSASDSFGPPLTLTGLGGYPNGIATGDMNGDGRSDIAVSCLHDRVAVLFNYAAGTFFIINHYMTASPWSIVVADFDRDGYGDIATANTTSTVSVFLYDNYNLFGPRMDFPTVGQPHTLSVGDVTGDGLLDLVTANSVGTTASVLAGNGDGTFASPASYVVGYSPTFAQVADFNRDGRLDIVASVVTGYDYPCDCYPYNAVSVLLQTPGGTFAPHVDYAVGNQPVWVAVADLTRDGILDLVTTNFRANTVTLLLGSGDGTFHQAPTYATGRVPWGVALADLNTDGRLDVVVANYYDATVSIRLGTGGGVFSSPSTVAVGVGPTALATGDVNDDGRHDVIALNTYSNSASVLLGAGDGTLGRRTDVAVGANPTALALADLNRDGHLDLAVTRLGTYIYTCDCYDTDGNRVAILLGRGDGTFGPPMDYPTGQGPTAVLATDVTSDGILDLVTANPGLYEPYAGRWYLSSSVSILIGHGDGTFSAAPALTQVTRPLAVAAGDVTGDGTVDLLVGDQGVWNFECTCYPGGDRVHLFRGLGDGTFASPDSVPVGLRPLAVAVVDGDLDGVLDVVALNAGGSSVSALRGTGAGRFESAPAVGTGPAPWGMALGDVNGDALPDIVTTNSWNNTFAVLLNTSPGAPDSVPPPVAADAPRSRVTFAPPAPNPASGTVALRYTLATAGPLTLRVYDARGRRVRTLMDGPGAPGEHVVRWNGRDDAGRRVPAGAYTLRLTHGADVLTQSVTIAR
jgi:hypothetical protein